MKTLIVIDMQNDFISGALGSSEAQAIVPNVERKIEEYVKQNGLLFVTDSTNLCDDYTRNKIRHNILPQIFAINPSFDKAFSKCVESVSSSNDFILKKEKMHPISHLLS